MRRSYFSIALSLLIALLLCGCSATTTSADPSDFSDKQPAHTTYDDTADQTTPQFSNELEDQQTSTYQNSQESQTSSSTEIIDVFSDYEISYWNKLIYNDSSTRFQQFYTPEEYVKLCTVASDMSAELCYAISSTAFSVHQEITTYNSVEDAYLVIDNDGNILIDYGDNSWVVSDLENYIPFGNLTFIKTNGNPLRFDIVDEKGCVVNSLQYQKNPTFSPLADLGDGYHLFVVVWDFDPPSYELYILQPSGICMPVDELPGYWRARIHMDLSENDVSYIPCILDATVGAFHEGLLPVCYSYSTFDGSYTCAFYCDTDGHAVINLSSKETNFHVVALGSFENGNAVVEFIGADGKDYTVVIDKEGNFIEEPSLKK